MRTCRPCWSQYPPRVHGAGPAWHGARSLGVPELPPAKVGTDVQDTIMPPSGWLRGAWTADSCCAVSLSVLVPGSLAKAGQHSRLPCLGSGLRQARSFLTPHTSRVSRRHRGGSFVVLEHGHVASVCARACGRAHTCVYTCLMRLCMCPVCLSLCMWHTCVDMFAGACAPVSQCVRGMCACGCACWCECVTGCACVTTCCVVC